MTKEELQTRIDKTTEKIEKINKRIAKWSTNMKQEAKDIALRYAEVEYGTPAYTETSKQYRAYSSEHSYDNEVYNQEEWNKGPNLGELVSAYCDLHEANKLLAKYQSQLDKLVNFEKADKIEVIWNFIQKWKESAYNFYIDNANQFIKLRENHKQAWEEYKKTQEYEEQLEMFNKWHNWGSNEYRVEKEFDKKYYSDIQSLTMDIVNYKTIDTEKLQKILDKEVIVRYNTLVKQVTDITGEITDASNLRMGAKGEINGIVIGEKGKAKVETFGAGGYNVQIFHYRTRVTEVR